MNAQDIEQLVFQEIAKLGNSGACGNAGITRPKRREHGDYSSSIALKVHKKLNTSAMECAQQLATQLAAHSQFDKVTVAEPGFINFFLQTDAVTHPLTEIFDKKETYGCTQTRNSRVLIEFISSNPTGPLHTGHGRGAAYGSALANLLRACGHDVQCEYYLNDAGRQTDILALSLWIRYLEQAKFRVLLPAKCYQGTYLRELAEQLYSNSADRYIPAQFDSAQVAGPVDDESQLDELITTARKLIGNLFDELKTLAINSIVSSMKNDLSKFRVTFDNWFSEKSLLAKGSVDAITKKLDAAGALYHRDGATWFAATRYEDNKDRVWQRANGEYTYFATDTAYHADKFSRGYDQIINLFGADHHGYVTRLKAALTALGYDSNKLQVLLIQLAYLVRNKNVVSMSTRSGSFVTLSDLIDETGIDASRFFYLMRRHNQHLYFDADLAIKQSRDNPVYYVQYAHARVSQILHQAKAKKKLFDSRLAHANLSVLEDDKELEIIDTLSRFPHTITRAGNMLAVNILTQYLRDLAALFHNYYASVPIVESTHWQQRICLCIAVQQVLANGLAILAVSTPERM